VVEEAGEPALALDELVDINAFDMDTTTAVHPDPTGEYDADVSQCMEDAPHASAPAPQPSPNPSETESERNVSEEALHPVGSEDEDVFGPAAMVHPIRTRKRSRRSRPLSDAQSGSCRIFRLFSLTNWLALPEAKRSKPNVSSASNSLPETKPALVADSDDDLDDCIEVQQPLSPLDRQLPVPPKSKSRGPSSQAGPSKSSILSSAGRWLSKVPSFGLFSPVRPPVEEESTPTDQSDRSARKARRARQKEKHPAVPELVPRVSSVIGKRRLVPVVDLSDSQQERKRRRTSEVLDIIPHVEGDEEDELLLSPESARRRRNEEEGAIAEAAVLRG